jgi:hypothetical protein
VTTATTTAASERVVAFGHNRDFLTLASGHTRNEYWHNGYRYCKLRSTWTAKRTYLTEAEAIRAEDSILMEKDRMVWRYKHFDHWHVTGLAPLLLPVLPPAIRLANGPGSLKSQALHQVPYQKTTRSRLKGVNVLRILGN